MPPLAKEVREEIAKIARGTRPEIEPPEIEPAGTASRLGSLCSGGKCVGAVLIVPAALLRIAQDFVGRADVFELRFRGFVPRIDIRMMLPRQLSVGTLDLLFRGTSRHAQDIVEVPCRHTSHQWAVSRLAHHAVSTEMIRGVASGRLGSRTSKTPFRYAARTLSVSTAEGRFKLRENGP